MQDTTLRNVGNDFRSTLIAIKWVMFLMERLSMNTVPKVFEYYARLGWISSDAQRYMTDLAAGIKPPEEMFEAPELQPFTPAYRKAMTQEDEEDLEKSSMVEFEMNEWRLTADDHMRSYMFIQELRGHRISKDEWNAIELRLEQFRQDLKAYYGV